MRIIIIIGWREHAHYALCEGYKLGMASDGRYVWMFNNMNVYGKWWELITYPLNCTVDDMREAISGTFDLDMEAVAERGTLVRTGKVICDSGVF